MSLPEKQKAVLEFVASELASGREFPSMEMISRHMKWQKEQSAYDCLCRIEFRGKVRRVRSTATEEVGGILRNRLVVKWELTA